MMKRLGYVMASRMLVEGRKPVLFMYRENPDSKQDSGWRFFCGLESEEYINDPRHIAIYDIRTILSIDPTVAPLLDAPEHTVFERENPDQLFSQVEDFGFGEGEE